MQCKRCSQPNVEPRHEVADAVCGMTIRELGERLGQPGVWVDAGDLAVLDQRGDDRPVVAALVGAREQGILAVEGQRSDRPLNGVGIELDAAIVEEDSEPVPADERVAYRFGQLALGTHLAEPGFQIVVQLIDDDAGVLVADCATMIGIGAANLALDGIETGDPLHHLDGNRRLVGEIEELAPDV